jgi:hypothetical protein
MRPSRSSVRCRDHSQGDTLIAIAVPTLVQVHSPISQHFDGKCRNIDPAPLLVLPCLWFWVSVCLRMISPNSKPFHLVSWNAGPVLRGGWVGKHPGPKVKRPKYVYTYSIWIGSSTTGYSLGLIS